MNTKGHEGAEESGLGGKEWLWDESAATGKSVGSAAKAEARVGDDDFSLRACAWPRRPKTQGPVRMIAPEEVPGWIVYEDARLLVVNKPGDVVCHPSKAGPWSSLVGALREYAQLPTVHLVFRLDRETSGVVVLTKDAKMASRLQVAMQERKVGKAYLAVMTGRLKEAVTVDQPLGDDVRSPVFVKSAVVGEGESGQRAVSHFSPLAWGAEENRERAEERREVPEENRGSAEGRKRGEGEVTKGEMKGGGGERLREFTLARVVTETGRKHQIRAHAQWLGHSLVGDKIYGPDARLYLDFIDAGWTPRLAETLLLPRQALHCAEIDLRPAGLEQVFRAPLAEDLRKFCAERGMVWSE